MPIEYICIAGYAVPIALYVRMIDNNNHSNKRVVKICFAIVTAKYESMSA